MNKYYENILDFQQQLKCYANCIFKTYGKDFDKIKSITDKEDILSCKLCFNFAESSFG